MSYRIVSRSTEGLFHSTRNELNWPAASQPSCTTRSLVTRVSLTTGLAAAKLGRLVLSQFVRREPFTGIHVSGVRFSSVPAVRTRLSAGGAATAWKLVKVDEKESTAVICLHVVASSRRDLAGHVGPYARTRAVLSGRKLRRQQLRPESPVTIIERRRRARSITQMSKDDAVYIHNCAAAAAGPPRTGSPVAVRHFSPSARATTLNRLAVNWNNMSRDLPRADRTEFLFSVGILSTVTRPIELILLGSGPYSSISNQIERYRFLTFKPYVS